jgi:hypothetical protein
MDSYTLSRNWFNFSFENTDMIKPTHTAIYFFAIEHCNRLGGKEKFGFPTTMAMEAIGIKKYDTYIKCFRDLVNWGFIKLIEKSTNQYSSNIIALPNKGKALGKALDKAMIKHGVNHGESTEQSMGKSIVSIDKQTNKQTNKQEIEIKISNPYTEILENDFLIFFEDNLKPKNKTQLENWADCLKKLVEIDKFTLREIGEVIMWARGDPFWSQNFMTILKLRKVNKEGIKYIDVFKHQMNKNGNQQRKTGNGATDAQIAEQFAKHFASDYKQ